MNREDLKFGAALIGAWLGCAAAVYVIFFLQTGGADPIRKRFVGGHSYLTYRQTIIHSAGCNCRTNRLEQ